jgi:hypothetical protein
MAYGPNFRESLIQAGLAGKLSLFGTGEIIGRENLTEAEEAALGAILADYDPASDPEAPPAASTRQAIVVAMAELAISGDEVSGIEASVNIGAAMALEPHLLWLFFATSQPDASYLAFVQSPGFNVDVTDRQADYFEVTVTDRATGDPAVPVSLSISVQRVQ